ncbi:MAG: hypothetical protein HQK89_08045 [Nitrospirae bacterium]|nr:hypothetical protein [Nitrospirota bacterium]
MDMDNSNKSGAAHGVNPTKTLTVDKTVGFVSAFKETLSAFSWHSRYGKTALIAVITICLCLSVFIRVHQYSSAKDYLISHTDKPIMTTADAYYWFRLAREYNNGAYVPDSIEEARNYPENGIKRPNPIPALSYLLAKLTRIFGVGMYKTGFFIIPFMSSLFMIPLIVYFYRMGYPAVAVMCALVATCSPIYFARTTIGRVDTDSLNLFFPFLCSLFIYLACKSYKLKNTIVYSILLGLSMYLFIWWYDHRGFLLIFAAFLITSMLLFKKPWKTIVLSLIIYSIFSGPYNLKTSVMNLSETASTFTDIYLSKHEMAPKEPKAVEKEIKPPVGEIKPPVEKIKKPNIYNAVDERVQVPFSEVLASLVGSRTLAIVGFIFFAIFATFRIKEIVPLLPIFLLGILSFTSGNRFTMYLAPFLGIGFGVLITAIVNVSINENSPDGKNVNLKAFLNYALPFVLLLLLFIKIPMSMPLEPVFDAKTHTAINSLKGLLKNNSVIFSWWDDGFAIEDLTGYKTIADGGAQNTSKVYLFARGLIAPSQNVLYRIISLIEKSGNAIADVGEKDIFDNGQFRISPINDNNYVLFTSTMTKVFPGLYFIGTWDAKTDTGKGANYDEMNCNEITNNVLNCDDLTIDLTTGQYNGVVVLKKATIIKKGYVNSEHDYFPVAIGANNMYLEIVVDENDRILNTYMINREVYESNFNRMFFLGLYDHKLFEETYNEFPYARVFMVKKADIQTQ